jgi:DNA invertase Pin-like site-specific DNA recombinase
MDNRDRSKLGGLFSETSPMLIGYARTSTFEQQAGLDAQLRDLRAAGCEKVFQEQVSATVPRRPELEAALDFARDGDVLMVTRLDRLARSVAHLLEITERLTRKGAALRILDPELNTSNATGRLLLTLIGAIAAFERELMLERQREGIARAKAAGKYRGRAPTARAKIDQVRQLRTDEGLGPTEIARRLGIGRSSVSRMLREMKLKRRYVAE